MLSPISPGLQIPDSVLHDTLQSGDILKEVSTVDGRHLLTIFREKTGKGRLWLMVRDREDTRQHQNSVMLDVERASVAVRHIREAVGSLKVGHSVALMPQQFKFNVREANEIWQTISKWIEEELTRE